MNKWRDRLDDLIYRLAFKSIDRKLTRSNGVAYLHFLSAQDWIREHPVSDELREATERFHESMKEMKQ